MEFLLSLFLMIAPDNIERTLDKPSYVLNEAPLALDGGSAYADVRMAGTGDYGVPQPARRDADAIDGHFSLKINGSRQYLRYKLRF